jgi:hypothetical protein
MPRPLQRTPFVVVLSLLLLLSSGCTSVRKIPAVEPAPPTEGRLVGVTTLAGTEVAFDEQGVIVRDTVLATTGHQPLRIPADSVQRWWMRRRDTGKTALLVVGITAGIAVAGSIIDEATNDPRPVEQSCPFVYSWDGERYVFDAEPYGGAITRGLERDDYGVLPALRPDSGRYRLLVTNEVDETQMTNLFELWAVDHPRGVRIVPDEHGTLHPIAAPQPPMRAVDQTGRDLTSWLDRDDRLIWEPLPVADSSGSLRDEIVMTFGKPTGASRAKLVVRAGTALWGSSMIRSLLDLRAGQVQRWYDSLDASPAASQAVLAWATREELYGLQVQVEEPEGWRTGGILPGSGPLRMSEVAVLLDVSRVTGDSLRVRIRPPRGFWALNAFAVDYTPDRPLAVDTLPAAASGPDGGIVTRLVASADTLYHVMPNTGDRVLLTFPAPPVVRDGRERTVVLHSRGWYRLHLRPSGPPDLALADSIMTVPGAAAEYSARRYRAWRMASGVRAR